MLVFLVQFIHFIILLFILFGAFLLHASYLVGYMLFIVATLIHWILLKGKCILTVWEEKLTNNPKLEPFNERVIKSLNIDVEKSTFNKCETGIMIGVIAVACLRIVINHNSSKT
jgi:Protein of Unknown function (DUF2784)